MSVSTKFKLNPIGSLSANARKLPFQPETRKTKVGPEGPLMSSPTKFELNLFNGFSIGALKLLIQSEARK